jgi:hypothetical protein
MSELDFLHEWDTEQPAGDIGVIQRRTVLSKITKARGLVAQWTELGGNPTATKLLAIKLGIGIKHAQDRLRYSRAVLESLK